MQKKESHLALYRKYRPTTFKDIIGQDHIVSVLEGSLKTGNVAHAYLFYGGRGIGKTSIARILARELGTSDNDLTEIDAASNNGVENIRDLREAVRVFPFDSKYKIYIFDEVHMLSKGAFNALLKTLEEPPEHVIFMLATTELEKVPDTIVSRCQVFTLKKPTEVILKEMVVSLAKKEGVKIDSEASELIAMLGDGSFRDTQGILQKVISISSDEKLTRSEVERVTGAPKQELVFNFITSLIDENIELGFTAIAEATAQNIDMLIFMKLVLKTLRTGLLLRYAPEMKGELSLSLSESEKNFFKDALKEKKGAITSKTLVVLLDAYQNMKFAFIPQLPLEIALVEILGEKNN